MKELIFNKILLIIAIFLLFSCNERKETNHTNKTTNVSLNINTENLNDSILVLGSYRNLRDTLKIIHDNGLGINSIINWTKENLKKNVRVKFLKDKIEGPKNDTIIIISDIVLEKLDIQGNETGVFYLGDINKIDYEKTDLFFSYREVIKEDKYNLVIYKFK